MRNIHCSGKVWLTGLAGLAGMLTASAQVSVPEAYALSSSSVDTSKPGFSVRMFQATGAELENTIARAEKQLAGYLVDKATGLPYANMADLSQFNADGTYNEPATISYSAGTFPGIPGTEGSTINIAMEAIAYIEYQPGTYAMVITSDDGAKLTIGNPYDVSAQTLLYSSGGTEEKVAKFTIAKAGVYGFRLVFEQGGGGYNVSWYSADPNDTASRTLVNESGGVTAYRALKSSVTTGPTVSAAWPLPGSTGATPADGLTATIRDGSTALNASTLKLFYNGTDVTASAKVGAKSGVNTTISFKPTAIPAPLAKEVYKLVYADPTATGGTREVELAYTMTKYANLTLPDPIYLETFDAFPEQVDAPAEYNAGNMNKWVYRGWTAENYTDQRTAGWDLNDPNSDAYLGWVVTSTERMNAITAWSATRRLDNVAVAYTNNVQVTKLADKNFFYSESDQRGGSQVQYLFSPDYDFTGKSNITLVFNSLYEQNQDSMGSLEYSIDKGKTWLPLLYMVEEADLKTREDGTVDAYATLSAAQGDTASLLDPTTGEEIGKTYGSFVGVTSNLWTTLDAYVSARVNDDALESKRVESYRLDKADGQAAVRLRFATAGTGSWYWGIDNVGFYSIAPVSPVKPTLSIASSGGKVTLSWTGSGTLQEASAITGPWTPATVQTNPQTLTPSGAKFYQLKQ